MIRRQKCKTVYCCFHPKDCGLWNEFKDYLAALVRLEYIVLISHLDIPLGENEQQMKAEYINKADIILLLFTHRFLADDDCYAILERAAERDKAGEALVFRIDLRPNYDGGLPLVVQLRQLPGNESVRNGSSRQERFVAIVKQFHQAILQGDE